MGVPGKRMTQMIERVACCLKYTTPDTPVNTVNTAVPAAAPTAAPMVLRYCNQVYCNQVPVPVGGYAASGSWTSYLIGCLLVI